MNRIVILLIANVCIFISSCQAQDAQSEMNQNSCNVYLTLDKELNQKYKTILSLYKSELEFIDLFKKAQRGWVAYRDLHLQTRFPGGREKWGSAYEMCRCKVLTELTRERIKYFNDWIDGIEEGDICAGSIRFK